jgi:outer membrane protein OmpA-like peptidoglycan-associated protein
MHYSNSAESSGGSIVFTLKVYFMKKTSLLVAACFVSAAIFSQNIVKEHYTTSGGLLGALNFSQFRVTGDNTSNIDYDMQSGWSAGAWVNFPLSKAVSLEPQVMYSFYRYKTSNTEPTLLLPNGKMNYISVPVGLKFHLGKAFALSAGPQVDFMMSLDDKNGVAVDDDFKSVSFSAFGGVEVLPRGPISIFGRYIHGFTNMDDRGNEVTAMKFKNEVIQAGVKIKLFGKKVPADSDGDGVADPNDKCPSVIGVARYEGCPIPDSDNDGINDEQDKCPNEVGTSKYNGCPIPDTDKDGINDEEDKCPNEAGTAKYNGCPIPDTDKDGINDEEDKCPDQAGPADRNGCPVSDRDSDGIADEADRCPDIKGVAANNGCPEVPSNVSKMLGSSAQNITFGATNAKLTTKSNASLDQVVNIMNENPGLNVRIEGHTDNAGNDDANMKLSEDRAAAVKAYIVSKGISEDRITSEGFGETMPIADNKTAAGRTKNRRIEIKVAY